MNQAHELTERIKELQCLYRISELVQRRDLILSELLRQIAQLIPSAWQYPESACARILYQEQAFTSQNFKERSWKQTSLITVMGIVVGSVEVCYLEEKKEEDEGPFLVFERRLIESIAQLLAETIERRNAEDKLQRLFRQQGAVSQLDQQALKGIDLSVLLNEAAQLTARILDVSICQILEHLPSRNGLLLRSGAGWTEEEMGRTIVDLDTESQAGYTLLKNQSVMVEDLEKEIRFRDLNLRRRAE